MPEGYGYSPEGIRRYLEDLARQYGSSMSPHWIERPDIPGSPSPPVDLQNMLEDPTNPRYVTNTPAVRVSQVPNQGPSGFRETDYHTGRPLRRTQGGPQGVHKSIPGPQLSEVGPSQRIPATQRRTLGQQPRPQPQPPGLQRPPVGDTGARGLGRGLSAVSGVAGSRSIISALDALRRNPPGQGQVGRALGGMAGVTEGDIARLQGMAPAQGADSMEYERLITELLQNAQKGR
jgi:hypothetical protein